MEMERNIIDEKKTQDLERTLFSKLKFIVRSCFRICFLVLGLGILGWIVYQGYRGAVQGGEMHKLVEEFREEGLSDALILELASTSDKSEAYAYLGTCFLLGKEGVVKNDSKALKWYRKAADLDNPTAQYNLALLYAYGDHGVNKDVKEALRLLYRVSSNPKTREEIKHKADSKIGELLK